MSIRTYVSTRPILFGGVWQTPKHLLAYSFTGMPLVFAQLAWNPAVDGRLLLQIDCDTAEHLDAVVEALASFGAHQKTLGSARTLAQDITGQTWTLTGDSAAERCDPEAGEGIAPPAPAGE